MLVGISLSDGVVDTGTYNPGSFELMYSEFGTDYSSVPIAKTDGKIGRAYMTYAGERAGYIFTPGKTPAEAWGETVKSHPYMEEK